MRMGQKSLLFGAHQFVLHPLCVLIAWRRIYGAWPTQVPVYVAAFLHDIGYWYCDRMDDGDGQDHPKLGADILGGLFQRRETPDDAHASWWAFSAGHSRYFAEKYGAPVSELMRADKYATVLMPLWLYLPLVLLTGECWEYVAFHLDAHEQESHGRWFDLWWWAITMRNEWRVAYGPQDAREEVPF